MVSLWRKNNMQIKIKDIKIGTRYRKDMGDLRKLAGSIKKQGLLQPIGIDQNNVLVFGQRRMEACKLLGYESIEARIVDVSSLLEGELAENEVRKQFNIEERVAIGKAVEDMLKKRKCKNLKNIKTRDIAAKQAGFGGHTTYQKAKVIVKKADKKQIERINTGKSSINAIYKEIKRVERKQELKKIPAGKLEGKYNVLLADPPWQYAQNSTSMRGVADDHYPTMTVEEIQALPVKEITLDNAVLFLWATTSMLKEAISVIEAWGFKFKTSMVWVKSYIGTGFYVRSKHEIILIGIKGSFLPMTMDLPESVFFADKDKHSKKPSKIYDIIESMYPEQRKVELFARNLRKDWASWGNEIEKI